MAYQESKFKCVFQSLHLSNLLLTGIDRRWSSKQGPIGFWSSVWPVNIIPKDTEFKICK